MSKSASKVMTVRTASGIARIGRQVVPALAVALAASLAGCANRDSITVGSIPDDYRTTHPIVIAEKNQKIDLPVGAGDRGMTGAQRDALLGFLDGYDKSAAPALTIAMPAGSANEVAAQAAGRDFARLAMKAGVKRDRIVMTSYQSAVPEASAPVRVAFVAVRAQTDKCGRWPDDLTETSDNKHYADFGCSYQNNLAAQVANPNDLIGPRKQSEIDAENRSAVIDVYRTRGISDEFLGNSEVTY
ncbi:pilus assembly protein CpaD [Mesorhizobium sp. M2A.F.Ca.ET.037.01.1.1]|uniref:CpaD family pilus assembly protein n=1 Tax=unclassified Mesorhizobium TaxID=325217 RepID=UPI000F75E0C4|nr:MULTISPECIES: CpaD family pilus assembly protein [unclassified Mesorhizobium]RUY12512.1 pilus assembly protein CpaD [Mesorhizobium sp. M2A.F.Ca.ET.040.01.1.1]RVC70463.1 pilus assembly protein CpaD [Mesorhizobium sp. M00.F.Ca.ET.038.03.1.1]AZO34565.1 pilus assembly protein CpaD [Mesorhizobium sp. M2A.F.Ca.ET.046.03.2.1]RUX20563.1 pilus assembly protein CpaD [Mesorhizobium sp. M2A.F.Ca.ET.037.01.1.1]RWA92793.1 MAG: pilus assembly protein CpaD [Mesorhizobium sp.]